MNKKELEKLLDRAIETGAEKDKDSFYSALYQFYFEMIYLIVYKRLPREADDIVQSIFYKLLKIKLIKFKAIFSYMDSYVVRIVLNFCADEFKRKAQKRTASLDSSDYYQNTIAASNVSDISWNRSLDVQQAITSIPERQRKAFLLHVQDGYRHKEIPKLLEESISPGASKQLVVRAKENLKKYLASTYSNR